ncbi:MAG: stage V sporulation protein AE [Sarcina sp.]
MKYILVFITGGVICIIGQIIKDKTHITPGKILVAFVTIGVILGGLGIYDKIVAFGGVGATIPLPGFGYTMAKGVISDVRNYGILGIFTGGTKASAGGIAGAIFFAYLMALIFNPNPK